MAKQKNNTVMRITLDEYELLREQAKVIVQMKEENK